MALRYQTLGKQIGSELKHIPLPPSDVTSEEQVEWFDNMLSDYRRENEFMVPGIPQIQSDDSSDDIPPERVKRPIPDQPPPTKTLRSDTQAHNQALM